MKAPKKHTGPWSQYGFDKYWKEFSYKLGEMSVLNAISSGFGNGKKEEDTDAYVSPRYQKVGFF